MNLHDLLDALLGLSVIALGVVGVWLFGRDAAADEHTVADYGQPVAPSQEPRVMRFTVSDAAFPRRLRPMAVQLRPASVPWDALTAPLAELGPAVEAPIYEHMAARVILRKLGEEARAKAGIRPAYATDVRDMTGSFPVARAAA